jgi:hypothetical protein
VALEVLVFAPNFRQFYCGDSLYWFSRLLEDGSDLVLRFRAVDDLGQYRPLTFIVSTWLVHPLAGLDPVRNHLFPLLCHAANTVAVFLLSRRMLGRPWQALAAAFVFGVSTVGAYVTYDNTFMPDYLYALFYLAGLIALAGASSRGVVPRLALAGLLFALALFSKEPAVTFPAAALVVLLASASPAPSSLSAALRRVAPFAAAALAYLAWHLRMKGGRLYPADAGQPHHLVFEWPNLRSKLAMIGQGLGLPTHLPLEPAWLGPLLLVAVGPIVAWTGFCLVRGLRRREPVYRAGAAWFALTIAPPLFVRAPTWEHNVYLPLVGFAWIVSEALGDALDRLAVSSRWHGLRRPVAATILVTLAGSATAHAAAVRRSSWMAGGSRITADCLADLRRLRPALPPNTLLYVEPSPPENVAWHFDGGHLAATFYRDPSIRMRFAGDGRPAPGAAMLATGKVVVLEYIQGHLYDATAARYRELLERAPYRVREHWSASSEQDLELPPPVTPPQPTGIRITPSPLRRGGIGTIEVLGGGEMEVDCRYVLDTENRRPRTVMSWLTTDASGRQSLRVDRPGRYRILAIRNALRSDWVPIDYAWECLP